MKDSGTEDNGTVYLYPVVTDVRYEGGIRYDAATQIRRREVPVSAIEFINKEGNVVISTLPYTVVFDK